jgi:hypothetical protein
MNIQRTNQSAAIGILLEQGKPLRRNIPGYSCAKEPGDCCLVTSMCEEQAEHRDFCAEGGGKNAINSFLGPAAQLICLRHGRKAAGGTARLAAETNKRNA